MSTTITVSNSVELAAALKTAASTKTPETILLAGGTYSLNPLSNYNPSAGVTVESANSSNKAVIEGLSLGHSSNFTFNDLAFTTLPTKSTGEVAAADFNNNVNFTNDTFSGPVSKSYASAPSQGLVIIGSTNSTVSNSVFQYVQNGLTERENNGITISGDSFSNLFGDGIDNAASSNVTISQNSFTSLHIDSADSQHSDCIQFWTSGETTAGGNIKITGNTYTIGSGTAAQGIFISDQVGDLTYSNVTIENNDLVGTGWNGITLQHVSGATVENNTLQSVISTGQTSRLSLDGGVSGLIENNKIGQMITEGVNTATVSGNTILAAINPNPTGKGAALAFASGMASLVSSSSAAATVTQSELPSSIALGSRAISLPRA
jgi:parallel beta-helix repeat protein